MVGPSGQSRIKSTGSSKCLQSALIFCLGKHVERNLQSKIKNVGRPLTSQSTNNSTGDNTSLPDLEFLILNFLVGSKVEAVAFIGGVMIRDVGELY